MNEDLKLIKKHYGENMMHFCRELFPTLLEKPGLLFKLLSDNFMYSKLLYDDIIDEGMEEEFKDFIYSFIDVENDYQIITDKTPYELLDEAGYTLYECKTEEDIQSFKKYYAPGEELCTFRGNRLDSCYVFFAVKKNVDEINREDKPSRQDNYGTSVISIQFRRGTTNNVSIKNRYNHTVNNPDSTFHNNLDNIIPGLTNSFKKQYKLNILKENSSVFELNNYNVGGNGKWYKYNYEINNIYYGPNNLVMDNFEQIPYSDPARTLILDYYIFDLEHKKIECYDEKIEDNFPKLFQKIDKMEIKKIDNSNDKELLIYHDNDISKLVFDRNNRIIKLIYNGNIKNLELCMRYNLYLKDLYIDKVKSINKMFGGYIFGSNINLEKVSAKQLEIIKDFCFINTRMQNVYFPNVKEIGNCCFIESDCMKTIELPNVEKIGVNFSTNSTVEEIITPKLKKIGFNCLNNCTELKKVDFSSVEEIGGNCFNKCKKLIKNEHLENLISISNRNEVPFEKYTELQSDLDNFFRPFVRNDILNEKGIVLGETEKFPGGKKL